MTRRLLLRLSIAVAVMGVVAAGVIVATRPSAGRDVVSGATTTTTPGVTVGRQPAVYPIAPPPPPVYEAADAVVPSVAYFAAAGDTAPEGAASNPTINHGPLVMRVLEDQGAWLHVQISKRPNGFSAWIHRADVSVRPIADHVVIELGARRLTLYQGNTVVMQQSVVVGKPSTPTPTGSYFIEGNFPTGNPGGAYGPLILTVSAFSDVYLTFAGGIGEIGIHGTNAPGLIGTAASHGCVRLNDDAITQLGQLAPPGTPVDILA